MKEYYISFGLSHPFSGRHVRIVSETMGEARDVMTYIYSNRWAFIYTAKHWKSTVMSEGSVEHIALECTKNGVKILTKD